MPRLWASAASLRNQRSSPPRTSMHQSLKLLRNPWGTAGIPNRRSKAVYTIYELDNLDVLRGMNSETVDLVTTDPPFKTQSCKAVIRTIYITLAALIVSVAIACGPWETYSETPREIQKHNNSAYEQPAWVALFTKHPKVLAYRWYRGDRCPSGEYSYRDDLYLFDNDEVLSEVEIQNRDPREKIIGTEGFHSTQGHICMALSEDIHPLNHTAIHELAHAIVYVEHGLTGHNKIHDRAIVRMALQLEMAGCRTKDYRLAELIALNKIIFRIGPEPTMTPEEQAISKFCHPPPQRAGDDTQPTRKTRATVAKQTLSPTPTPDAKDRFVEIHYDASQTINNRQLPAGQPGCRPGSGPTTIWSRTINVESAEATIQDANRNTLQVKELHFSLVYPGRSYEDSTCRRAHHRAWATLVNLNNDALPNLTGYVAEWRDGNDHLIQSTHAHEAIAINVSRDEEPEALFDKPARFLLYDNHTLNAQPTPTPVPNVPADDKQILIELNPLKWEASGFVSTSGKRHSWETQDSWVERTIKSPEFGDKEYKIYDAKNQPWHVRQIVADPPG